MPNLLDQITAYRESRFRDFDSRGRPLRSPKGALFQMQVMPSTARSPGFGLRPADPNDPNDMNRLGREYRAAMEKRYGGDMGKMWGAYNWGPGNMDRALARHGENWLRHAPPETRDYVTKNLAMYQQNMARRGTPQAAPQYNYLAMTPVQNGVDPLAPKIEQPGLAQMQQGMPQMPQQPNFAAMSPVGRTDPLAPKPKAFGKGGVGWQVLGILGDAMRGYAGQAPVFAPAMMAENEAEREDNRFRERLQAQIEMQREKALAPKPPTQTDRYVQEVLDPRTPMARRQLLLQILTRPMTIAGADGSATTGYFNLGEDSGEDDWEYDN